MWISVNHVPQPGGVFAPCSVLPPASSKLLSGPHFSSPSTHPGGLGDDEGRKGLGIGRMDANHVVEVCLGGAQLADYDCLYVGWFQHTTSRAGPSMHPREQTTRKSSDTRHPFPSPFPYHKRVCTPKNQNPSLLGRWHDEQTRIPTHLEGKREALRDLAGVGPDEVEAHHLHPLRSRGDVARLCVIHMIELIVLGTWIRRMDGSIDGRGRTRPYTIKRAHGHIIMYPETVNQHRDSPHA